jgi:hypothetical protein
MAPLARTSEAGACAGLAGYHLAQARAIVLRLKLVPSFQNRHKATSNTLPPGVVTRIVRVTAFRACF